VQLRDIARLLSAELELPPGVEEREIFRVAKIEQAGEGDITFLANPKYLKFLAQTRASAVIVGKNVRGPETPGPRPALLRVDDPYVSFVKVFVAFNPPHEPLSEGVHPTAVIAPSAELSSGVRVGARAVVGEHCRIGAGTMICAGAILADRVQVGESTLIYQNVTVREDCRIGSRVIIQPGAVIGSDGFGFAPTADGTYEKIPQVGIVVIEDDVEIGANCAVDRATMGETRIRRGTKLDNLIQIAHNVVVGENTVMAAQVGVSGSTRVGSNCQIGGQVGFTGHIDIADGTKIGAQSGVHRSVQTPGQTYFGYPAYPHREAMRIYGAMTKLPELMETVRELMKKIELLEQKLQPPRP
jgi:UDP-3-O-[3-hydroxymyristoyl] glucosamine N-acyltransferase